MAQRGIREYNGKKMHAKYWIEYFGKMNSVHPYHKKEHFNQHKHFIFSFHDTTLEVVAEGYEIETINGSLKKAISIIKDRLI